MSVSSEMVARPRGSNPTSARCDAPRLRSNRPATTSKHRGQRDLADDQRVAQREAAAADLAGRRLAAQIADQAWRRCLERGQQAGKHAGERRDEDRERQHARVDAQIERDIDRQRQLDALQSLHERPRQRDGGDGAERAEQRAFDEQLLNQPAAAGADGEAHADLAPARRGARQQHAGDVRARDQQHEADHGHQSGRANRQDAARLRHEQPHVLGRHRGHLAVLVRLHVRRFELTPDQRDVGVGLLRGHAGLQPALHEHPAEAAPLEARLADRRRHRVVDAGRLDFFDVLNGQPQLRRQQRHDAGERLRRDADDRVRPGRAASASCRQSRDRCRTRAATCGAQITTTRGEPGSSSDGTSRRPS